MNLLALTTLSLLGAVSLAGAHPRRSPTSFSFAGDPLLFPRQAEPPAVNSSKPVYTSPPGSPGFYQGNSSAAVTFDRHSLFIDGERVFIFSLEIHPWRLPVPSLWKDVLEKFKAAGANAVSIYLHWGLQQASQDAPISFDGFRNLTYFYDVAAEVGLYVILRPGPYINAETTGGGLPGWLTNVPALARTNATLYTEAWTPYISAVAQASVRYQYPDGPVIMVQSENEFFQEPTKEEHMQLVIENFRENGLTRIPTIHNDRCVCNNFVKGTGMVDLYGWDGYPNGFDCSNPEVWNEVPNTWDASHKALNPTEPLGIFEFQGGAFDPWSGPGYEKCSQLLNEQFANVFYKNNIAASVTLLNLYMGFGGTNWGNLANPTIYTSYDYGAAVSEDRTLTPKHAEIRLLALFLHASPDLLTAERIGNGSTAEGTAYSDSDSIYTTHLGNEDGFNFYIVRQTTNNNTADTDFTLRVNTTAEGEITVPRHGGTARLAGRESKIFVSDYTFGSHKLRYSTAEVATWLTVDASDVLVLYALEGQDVEVAVEVSDSSTVTLSGSEGLESTASDGLVTLYGSLSSSHRTLATFPDFSILVLDKKTASAIFQPFLNKYSLAPFSPSVLVSGPYLVRSASVSSSTLDLVGDTNGTTTVQILAPAEVTSVTWNGEPVDVQKNELGWLQGDIAWELDGVEAKVPKLDELEWTWIDSLPEVQSDFDDVEFVVANKTETHRPQQPFGGKNVLYASEYAFHAGTFITRGYFNGTSATAVDISVQGGYSFGFSAFLNGQFLESGQGTSSKQGGTDNVNTTLTFPQEILNEGTNVLTIISDSTGLNQDYNVDDEFKSPRGVRGYNLTGGEFSHWTITGNVGGENAPDLVRGPYNEGGLYVERIGGHLPGYDASSWTPGSPVTDGIPSAGVRAFRIEFDLDLPEDADVPLDLTFGQTPGSNYRARIWVNGWEYGRYTNNYGPQTVYPIPEGILDHRGHNVLVLALWSLDAEGAKIASLELSPRTVLASGKGVTEAVESPGWAELRGYGPV